ncbi:MAG: hypothetical protein A2745_00175 [Candidatus Harrisonbacteria bacterium RIFCSPHIGHO2_01_FULL_44_13]|uniref:DUF2283 domain-containing protein n=1 Tax=Candidatus Harrisonbacteria bacterium RIFCSPLOWO2_01_FULL_44_18 TaxID=1798407 RepID=A0A1G1ZKW9_9BACT|nr:MAG: hypothetical protein A2745_00175 [Candidatus Harrisonbacteria bacterium RIFCSPHIGHO2_01_FULL_44_13]OGY65278.1 MAG: hypothetical protein A3A16_02015 [Candidatus Harrisonbacteria bacterium RIFCSPLOWO2_01_FULL_44_18]
MKIEYDKEADALYISFKKAKIHMTVEKGKDIIEDFDEGGSVVGVEILDYSQKVSPKDRFQISSGQQKVSVTVR